MKNKNLPNQAFIDGQNLYMNTKCYGWNVDFVKFRRFLKEKFQVDKAYYFIGSIDPNRQSLYDSIQEAGFILKFRAHAIEQVSAKKGNVDTDIVFTMLSKVIDREKCHKFILVSGDGDYFRTVDFLIKKDRFLKLLPPSHKSMSSLYKLINNSYVAYLDEPGLKRKIARTK